MPVLQDYYTWKTFREKVLELMPVNAQRKGVGQSVDTYLTAIIRQGVIRLQTAIDSLRRNHECIYELTDLAQEGCAMAGVKPPESVQRNVFWVKLETDESTGDVTCTRYPITIYPWGNRYALINGNSPETCHSGLMAIAPDGYKFYVYPTPPDGECWRLSMFYDGLKLDFRDAEEVPFDEMVAGAVSEFASAHIAMQAERDIVLRDSHMREYNRMTSLIHVREKEKRSLDSGVGGVPADTCATCIDITPDDGEDGGADEEADPIAPDAIDGLDIWLDSEFYVYTAGDDVLAGDGEAVWEWRGKSDQSIFVAAQNGLLTGVFRDDTLNGLPVVEYSGNTALTYQFNYVQIRVFGLVVKLESLAATNLLTLQDGTKLGIRSDGVTVVRDSGGSELLTGPAITAGEYHKVLYVVNSGASYIRVDGENGSSGNLPEMSSLLAVTRGPCLIAALVNYSQVPTASKLDGLDAYWDDRYNL